MTDDHSNQGPLRFTIPPPSGRERRLEAARAVRHSLRGHSTSDLWLPEGLWPELDEARAELLRLRAQAVAEQDEHPRLRSRFAAEDKQRARDLRQAQRDGTAGQVEDRCTPSDQRQAQLTEVSSRFWAAVSVMAEEADRAVELVGTNEDLWLGELRGLLGPVEEKRREVQRQLAEAETEEWQLHQLGGWLQKTADDGAFGRQPAPTPTPPPKQFSAERFESMLNRPWHKRREAEELPRSWQESEHEDVEPLSGEDRTGVVSELEPEAAA